MTDAGAERILLLVADTRKNRAMVREFRELLIGRYPIHARAALASLRSGELPTASAIVLL
jgi:hypothetical protein